MSGCRYAIISPNQQFVYILSGKALTLFSNVGNEDIVSLCSQKKRLKLAKALSIKRFPGGYNTYMIIESNSLNVYSQASPNGDDKVVYSLQIADPNTPGPFCLVLDDNGTLSSVNTSTNKVSSSNIANANNQNSDVNGYNAALDLERRLRNLKAYLIFRGFHLDIDTDLSSIDMQIQLPIVIPTYDPTVDWEERFNSLLKYLHNSGKISNEIVKSLTLKFQKHTQTHTPTMDDLLGADGPYVDGNEDIETTVQSQQEEDEAEDKEKKDKDNALSLKELGVVSGTQFSVELPGVSALVQNVEDIGGMKQWESLGNNLYGGLKGAVNTMEQQNRLLNLQAYLKMRGYIIESYDPNVQVAYTSTLKYDPNVDWKTRFDNWQTYVSHKA